MGKKAWSVLADDKLICQKNGIKQAFYNTKNCAKARMIKTGMIIAI